MKRKILVFIIITIIGITFITIINYVLFSTKFEYYANWKINIPEPKEEKKLISERSINDSIEFSIYNYNNKQITQLTKNKYFKKINPITVNKILDYEVLPVFKQNKKYNSIINKNFKRNNIINDNNYYTYLFKNQSSYRLIVLETNTNKMYIFSHM